MADPRDTLSHIDSGTRKIYKHDSTIVYDDTKDGNSAQAGLAVALITTDSQVTLVGNAERVLGKLIEVYSDGYCLVQVDGWMTLPGGDGATLTVGESVIGDLGAASAEGYIRAAAGADADEARLSRGWIEDNDTTTAVVVYLGG